MAKSRKPDYYISLLRGIKDLNQKINLAYELKEQNKIYIYAADMFDYDSNNNRKINPLIRSLVKDISYLQIRGYDVHSSIEPQFEIYLFFVEHNDSIINLLSNLKRFKR